MSMNCMAGFPPAGPSSARRAALLDRQRVRRRARPAAHVERGGDEEALVDAVPRRVGGERVEDEHLADRDAEAAEDPVVEEALGLEDRRRRPDLERRRVGAERARVVVEEVLRHRLAALEAREPERLDLRERVAGGAVLALVPADPAGADQDDVPGLELDALGAPRRLEVRDADRVRGGAVERAPLRLALAGDVEQHGAARDAAARPVVDAEAARRLLQRLVGDAAPEAVLEVAHVTEAVPLA